MNQEVTFDVSLNMETVVEQLRELGDSFHEAADNLEDE